MLTLFQANHLGRLLGFLQLSALWRCRSLRQFIESYVSFWFRNRPASPWQRSLHASLQTALEWGLFRFHRGFRGRKLWKLWLIFLPSTLKQLSLGSQYLKSLSPPFANLEGGSFTTTQPSFVVVITLSTYIFFSITGCWRDSNSISNAPEEPQLEMDLRQLERKLNRCNRVWSRYWHQLPILGSWGMAKAQSMQPSQPLEPRTAQERYQYKHSWGYSIHRFDTACKGREEDHRRPCNTPEKNEWW